MKNTIITYIIKQLENIKTELIHNWEPLIDITVQCLKKTRERYLQVVLKLNQSPENKKNLRENYRIFLLYFKKKKPEFWQWERRTRREKIVFVCRMRRESPTIQVFINMPNWNIFRFVCYVFKYVVLFKVIVWGTVGS